MTLRPLLPHYEQELELLTTCIDQIEALRARHVVVDLLASYAQALHSLHVTRCKVEGLVYRERQRLMGRDAEDVATHG